LFTCPRVAPTKRAEGSASTTPSAGTTRRRAFAGRRDHSNEWRPDFVRGRMRRYSAAESSMGMGLTHVHLTLPDLASVARHAGVRVIEGVVIPLALFLIGLRVFGAWGAMTVGLAWSYGLIAARLLMRRSVPGILFLGAITLTARTIIALSAHSIT